MHFHSAALATLAGAPSWAGSVPTWALLAVALFAAYRVTKGGGGAAVEELSISNQVLSKALERQKQVAVEQANKIAALESKTDVVLAVTPLIADHERKAQERHDATLHVLEAISDRLTLGTNGKDHT